MKKILFASLVAVLAVILAISAFAASTDHGIKLSICEDSEKFPGKTVVRLDLMYSPYSNPVASQDVNITYDATVLTPLFVRNGEDASDSADSFYDNTASVFVDKTRFSTSDFPTKNEEVYFYALISDGKGYISWNVAESFNVSPFSEYKNLGSVYFALNGKDYSSLTEKDIGFSDISVDSAITCQSAAVSISDGRAIYSYGGLGADTLTVKPEVVFVGQKTASGSDTPEQKTEQITEQITEEKQFTLPEDSEKEWENPFADVSEKDKFYTAVRFVYENDLFKGVSAHKFAPETTMTRAMFVTVLGRLDGVNEKEYTKISFDDVKKDEWYTAYVGWAADKGIVNGYGNGKFGVDDKITVEQATAIIARYARYKKLTTEGTADLKSYKDGADVSDWAKSDMSWALSSGIYQPQNGKLTPKSPAPRSLVATMIYGYVKYKQ